MQTKCMTESYVESKKHFIQHASLELEDFLQNQNGKEWVDDYYQIRNDNITEENLFSVNIPWILADLCGVDAKKCISIASSWEAILLYVKQLDHISDKNSLTQQDKKNMLISSMLFAHGLEELKNIIKIKADVTFSSLYESAKYQSLDMLMMLEKKSDISMEEHLEIMRGKNIFTKVISQFYVENSNIGIHEINKFIDNLATFAQIIDDIKDLEEDYKTSSYSHLIYTLQAKGYIFDTEDKMMQLLLSTGLLTKSLIVAKTFMENTINIAKRISLSLAPEQKMASEGLILYLSCQLVDINDIIKQIENFDIYDENTVNIIRSNINGLYMGS